MLTLSFIYHELRAEPSNYTYVTQCANFAEQLVLFKEVTSFPHMLQPQLTFDDGHSSNFEFALPMLMECGMTAHFFITVGWTNARLGYMRWNEIKELHASGQHVGAHGLTHTMLTRLKGAALQLELRGARETLEDRLGSPVDSMSLPGGRFNRRVLEACAEAGYTRIWTSLARAEPLPLGSVLGRLNVRSDMRKVWIETLLRPESGVLRSIQNRQRFKEYAKMLLGDRLYAEVWAIGNRQEPESSPPDSPSGVNA